MVVRMLWETFTMHKHCKQPAHAGFPRVRRKKECWDWVQTSKVASTMRIPTPQGHHKHPPLLPQIFSLCSRTISWLPQQLWLQTSCSQSPRYQHHTHRWQAGVAVHARKYCSRTLPCQRVCPLGRVHRRTIGINLITVFLMCICQMLFTTNSIALLSESWNLSAKYVLSSKWEKPWVERTVTNDLVSCFPAKRALFSRNSISWQHD